MRDTEIRFGPAYTPQIVTRLLVITIGVSLFSALWESLTTQILGWPGLDSYLALSRWGISHYFVWQFVTYLFIIPSYGLGITISYLVSMFFMMYLLWVMGSAVCNHGGPRQFLELYFTSGIVTGLVGFLMLWLFKSHTLFAGPGSSLLTLFTVWCFLNPEAELLLFFLFPIKIKWLFAGVTSALALVFISQLDVISLVFYSTALSIGYLFSTTVWEIGSPFTRTDSFDKRLIRFGRQLRKRNEPSDSKIVQLFKGKPELDDEAFVDAMLNKISQSGPDSLTWQEKKRMDTISKKHQK